MNCRQRIGDMFSFEVIEFSEVRAVFAMPSEPKMANPLGTLELKVNYIRTVPVDGRRLIGTDTIIHVGRKVATAESRAIDTDGKLVAPATTTCMIYR